MLIWLPGLTGCGSFHYLLQAGEGELSLINHARPISEVLEDGRTPPRIRSLLAQIPAIKQFGEQNGLKPTHNYTDYVKLDRPVAVYVVSASAPLEFKSKEWSFPIVGRIPYLGWFHRDDAIEFAQELKQTGWDVDLRGAGAFSTLGWFRDPVVSSMIPEGDEAYGELVNVVLHESVHATIYISGQAYFNESLASFVADRLTPIYIAHVKGPGSIEESAYLKAEEQSNQIEEKFHATYQELAAVYASKRTDAEKLAEKRRILAKLKEEVGFRREINNATLIQYRTYHVGQREFTALYAACGADSRRFLGALSVLKPSSFSQTQQEDLDSAIMPLVKAGCPASAG